MKKNWIYLSDIVKTYTLNENYMPCPFSKLMTPLTFYMMFDYSSYLKKLYKYQLFCCDIYVLTLKEI